MASAYTSKWKRQLQRWIPWLFSECPGGNKHWRWDLTCFCVIDENSQGMYFRRHNSDHWRECPHCVEERNAHLHIRSAQ